MNMYILYRTSIVALLTLTGLPLKPVLAGGLRGSLRAEPEPEQGHSFIMTSKAVKAKAAAESLLSEADELFQNDEPEELPILDLEMVDSFSEAEMGLAPLLHEVAEEIEKNERDGGENTNDDSGKVDDAEEEEEDDERGKADDAEEEEEDEENEEDEDEEEHEAQEQHDASEENDEASDESEDEDAEDDDEEESRAEAEDKLDSIHLEDQIQHLTRVGALADTNNDNLLSHTELMDFAERLQNKARWKRTMKALSVLDNDGDGSVARDELGHIFRDDSSDAIRFKAADFDDDGMLNETELHHFSHPEVHSSVLQVEAEHRFNKLDLDKDGFISFAEYKIDEEAHEGFDLSSAWEDFAVLDTDASQDLSMDEFNHLISGRMLLSSHIVQAIAAADSDGDGHIHLHDEVSSGHKGLLGTEFIEDYFYHESIHEEL